jgi:hypothetical protein
MSVDVMKVLVAKRNEIQQQLDTLDAAIKVMGRDTISGNPKKRVVSAAAKRKMSLAAKKRWAEKKKTK